MFDTRHPEERPVGSVGFGPRYDENAIQEAAEFVAARHIDTRSPEWVAFVWDRIDRATTAALLRGDLTVLQPLREGPCGVGTVGKGRSHGGGARCSQASNQSAASVATDTASHTLPVIVLIHRDPMR